MTKLTEPCCKRDTDGDGNCPIHSAPGLFRYPQFNEHELSPDELAEMAKGLLDRYGR